MKILIFDASTLITFAMNGLLPELKELKKIFNGKFIITKEVKKEIIDRPITIKKFKLEALKLQQLLDEKIIEMPSSLGVDIDLISKKTIELLRIANEIFRGDKGEIKIIGSGETSCLALSKVLNEKKLENVIAVDERTTRILGEKPENLVKLLQKKLHIKIILNKKNFEFFKGFKFIRSSELVYVMYKKGIFKIKSALLLDALLYAVKFKGCAISDEEIKEIKRL